MGKNGGDPSDTILTLEEALKRFKRKRSEEGVRIGDESVTGAEEGMAGSNVHAIFSATVRREEERAAASDLISEDFSVSAPAQRNEANAGMPASEDLVAMIDGIPRTLHQLEQLAAAEKAYAQDFPDDAQVDAEVDEDDSEDSGEVHVMALAARHSLVRDYAFTAMGTALMVLVAFLMTRVPTVNNNNRPNLVAQSIATPALKASSLISTADLITNLVMVPDVDEQFASSGMPKLKSDELEARIKDTLKLRAFTDIGVSVSSMGDAYLAGEVYSLNEARKISQIVHRVNGVNQVHFLHPDVQPADRPAYFGVTTAFAPEVWGAKVRAVFIGSPADKAGIKPGDVISEFDGKTVPDGKTLNDIIAQYAPGQRVQFRVWHDGQPEYLVARIGELTTVASR